MHRLSSDQVASFKREGYVLFHEPVFPAPKFEALKSFFERKLETWALESGGQSPEAMDVPHFRDPALFEWLFAPEVLDLVEPLLGPDIALWSSHFIAKPAGVGKRVPWHEDSAYWGRILDPMGVVTVWLAIDPSTTENGCLRVIPGTHLNGYSEYQPVADASQSVFASEMKADQLDESKAVDLVLAPDECSIHDAKLVHGSEPNTSTKRRCGFTMRYVSASSAFRPEPGYDAFQIYLARGQDRAGNHYGDPTQPNRKWLEADGASRNRAKLLSG